MFKLAKVFSITLLFLSTLLVLWANSLWQIWVCMEINLLFFIYWSFFNVKLMLKSSELNLVYFIVQSSSSLGLFWAVILNSGISEHFSYLGGLLLLLKLGLFPFHYWLIYVVEMSGRMFFYILMVLQKIIPLAILRFTGMNLTLLFLNLIASIVLSFSELKIYKILVYSSIFNIVWLLTILPDMWGPISLFYLVYGFTIAILIYYLPLEIEQTSIYWVAHSSLSQKVLLVAGFLSLAGFPSTIGFYTKLMVSLTVFYVSPLLFATLITCSTAMFYLYLRIFFAQMVSSGLKLVDYKNLLSAGPILSSVFLFSPLVFLLALLHGDKKIWAFIFLLNKSCSCSY